MFKKTRIRIFTLIMAVATVIIIVMLSVIYIANSHYNYERGISLLESYINNDKELAPPGLSFDRDHRNLPPEMNDKHKKMFNLSTFYSVFFNANGNVVRIESEGGLLYSDDEILAIAENILQMSKVQGSFNKMPFLVHSDDNGTIVALIDNTMEIDNSSRQFRYLLIVGISGWIIVALLSWFFTKRIVNPLEQNDIKQKQFISDAGHELKTPISVISANADLLSMEIGENKWLSNIQYENERMGILVKQLLELVRAENMQQTKENLDFSRLVSGGALPFESVAFENNLILETDIENDIFISGNQNQLSQLISILIDNAIEHGSSGKNISVKLYSTKHDAIFSVTNSGEPIPIEIQDRLFERFYRMDESRTDSSGHYGLGLAIAKAVVTAHNGRIEINCSDNTVEFRAIIPKA